MTGSVFITEFNAILEVLDQAEHIFLYDTVAISKHELIYTKHNQMILKQLIQNHPILLTRTIYNELQMNEPITFKRYMDYFANFKMILIIEEIDFFALLHTEFVTAHALSKFQECSQKAFQTIQPLASEINQLQKSYHPNQIVDKVNFYFNNGKNKGEYSLLWISIILNKIYPNTKITFIGLDRDLYYIVDFCFFRHVDLRSELSQSTAIEIVSTDSLLQGIIRSNQQDLDYLIKICRNDEQRKVLFKEIIGGITSNHIKERAITNTDFKVNIENKKLDIIY